MSLAPLNEQGEEEMKRLGLHGLKSWEKWEVM